MEHPSHGSHEATGLLHVLTCISYGRWGTPSNQYGRTWSLPVAGKMYGAPIQNTGGTGRLHVLPYWLLGVPRRPYEIHVRTWRTPVASPCRDQFYFFSIHSSTRSLPVLYFRKMGLKSSPQAINMCFELSSFRVNVRE